jgi:hypothetical protein
MLPYKLITVFFPIFEKVIYKEEDSFDVHDQQMQ